MSDAAPRVFAGAVSRAWANSGGPSYNAIAAATGSSLLPLSVSDVRRFLEGTALPSSSLQIELLFSALADVSGTPVNPVLRRDAIRSWLVASGADIDLYEPTGAGLEGISDILNHVVEVATYLGVAGAGGIIGNRADAAAVVSAKRMFSGSPYLTGVLQVAASRPARPDCHGQRRQATEVR